VDAWETGSIDLDGASVSGWRHPGVLGIALAYLPEMQALRVSGPRAVGIFFSLDPAVATVVGLVFLSQTLSAVAIVGLVAVVSAGCLTSAIRRPS
jgi:inner membrane transporter RhtA